MISWMCCCTLRARVEVLVPTMAQCSPWIIFPKGTPGLRNWDSSTKSNPRRSKSFLLILLVKTKRIGTKSSFLPSDLDGTCSNA